MAEKLGIPAVSVAATSFLSLVQLVGAEEGVAFQRYAEYPGTISVESDAVIRKNIEKMTFEQVIRGLTEPVAESADASMGSMAAGNIALKGDLEDITESLRLNDMTDGLAIAPPTMERIEEFLKFTDRAPEEEIAVRHPPPEPIARAIPDLHGTESFQLATRDERPATAKRTQSAARIPTPDSCSLTSVVLLPDP